MRKKFVLSAVFFTAVVFFAANNMPSYAAIPPNKPPRFAIDFIHGYSGYDLQYGRDNIRSQAVSLGYRIHEITGDMIQESDLDGTNIVLSYLPCLFYEAPDYTQTEIDLLVDYVVKGGALCIVPFYCWSSSQDYHDTQVSTSVNVLYDHFGFRVSGEHYVLEYPTIVVESTHPIMDGVNKIQILEEGEIGMGFCRSVATLSKLETPCEPMCIEESHPLFLVSSLGEGKVFIDLTARGIGTSDIFDNLLVVRNALIWLRGISTETYRVVVDDVFYDIRIKTNSILSAFNFDNISCKIHFYTTGLGGTIGFCNVTVPKSLMWCDNIEDWIVTVDDNPPSGISKTEDSINTYLYFTYDHSTHDIDITGSYVIPEFPPFLILPLFVMATILAVILSRKIVVSSRMQT